MTPNPETEAALAQARRDGALEALLWVFDGAPFDLPREVWQELGSGLPTVEKEERREAERARLLAQQASDRITV